MAGAPTATIDYSNVNNVQIFSALGSYYIGIQTATGIAGMRYILISDIFKLRKEIGFDTAGSAVATKGTLRWNTDDDTLELILAGGVVLQLGDEMFIFFKNNSGVTIGNGKLVMYSGSVGASGKIEAELAVTDGSVSSKMIIGIATQEVTNGNWGRATVQGKVRGINTDSWIVGDLLYPKASTPGDLQNTEPSAPNLKTSIAIVTVKSATVGSLLARAPNGYNFKELHDVEITGIADKDITHWSVANSRWENTNRLTVAEADIDTLESYLQPYDDISYNTNGYTNGRACETEHELYLAGKYLIESAMGSLDPESASKALSMYITISSVEYLGVITHEWQKSTSAPRIKFVYSGGTVYYDKDDTTVLDSSIRVYSGYLRNLSGEKDLRYDLPASLVALYDAGDNRNSIRYSAISAIASLVSGFDVLDPLDLTSGWLTAAGVTIDDLDSFTSTGAGGVYKASVVVGKIYKVIIDITKSAGTYSVNNSNGSSNPIGTANGTYYFQALTTYVYIRNIDAGTTDINTLTFEEVLSGDITGTGYIEEAHDIVGTEDIPQTTESLQPQLVDGIMEFDGVDDFTRTTAFAITNNFTLAYRSRYTDAGRIRLGQSGARINLISSILYAGLTSENLGSVAPVAVDDRYIMICNTGVLSFYKNGVEVSISQPSAPLTLTDASLWIGEGLSGYSVTKTKALYLFDTALTLSEISQLDAILEAE